ncbi:MAG: aminopeptidase P family protein [Prolixibacteraceae bacterium]|nr:aminopeptidase P family protein [Prolixibacteraceae bacterium]MBN2650599.1 aminopeptidase P family protein [Prolixibacteraceae bacterium]
MTVTEKIELLRSQMKVNNIQAYLINGSDPHMSEYVPARWQSRPFVSGFTGSYGWLAITSDKAALWTDSRYYLQAGEQLKNTGIVMMKAREPEETTLEQWVKAELKAGDTVAFDGTCYAVSEAQSFESEFKKNMLQVLSDIDLLEKIWKNRPALPNNKAFLHPINWAGLSRSKKIEQLRTETQKMGANLLVLTALDDIGWTFNIRGADVECNPVVLSFALISNHKTQLFVQSSKFDEKALMELNEDGIELLPYESFYSELQQIKEKTVAIDPARSNFKIQKILEVNNKLVYATSPASILKSRKNKAELDGMKKAQIADGLALLDFQTWLEANIGSGNLTEYDVAMKLEAFRSSREGYVGTSFFPIVGYLDHGAIVHFKVTDKTANKLKPEGILLFDSGGQYRYGTTDITRTISLGPVSYKMKRDFTQVLRGMINLSSIKFPKGTIGCHLDVLARAALWNDGKNYGHGTGHGVGAFMNVHEGPQSIRPDLNNQPLKIGQILSNEPGIYRTGEYGIRTENMIHVVENVENEFGIFYRFETLTKYPIDTRLIDTSLLTNNELEWINNYHSEVFDTLSPYANQEQLQLLKRLTMPIAFQTT